VAEAPVRTHARPGAAPLVSLGTSLVGVAVSTYLTIEHYNAKVALVCPDTGTVNCAKVTTSSYSHLGPVPFALLGLLFFVAMTALCTPAAWRRPELAPLRVIGAVAGVVTVIYLVWAELFKLNAICLWCTVVHACSIILLGAVLWQTTSAPRQ
jgi:uncharacterized membrane protein